MGIGSRAALAASLGFAVSFLVACGGGKGLLSTDQASGLNNQLSEVSQAVATGNCRKANAASRSFSSKVAALPSTVNTTLVHNLGQGAATVGQLAAKDCQSSSSSSSTSSTPTTTSTATVTTTRTTSTQTNPTSSSSSSSSTSTTVTNPTSSSSTSTSNGGAGFGGTGTAGNSNGQ